MKFLAAGKTSEDVGKLHKAIHQQARLIDLAHKSEMKLLVNLEEAHSDSKSRMTKKPILHRGRRVPAASHRGHSARARALVQRALAAGLNEVSFSSVNSAGRGIAGRYGEISLGNQ